MTSKDGLLSSEWIARTGKAERERKQAKQERDELATALDFYAAPRNYLQPSQMAGEDSHSAIEIDAGMRARAVLWLLRPHRGKEANRIVQKECH